MNAAVPREAALLAALPAGLKGSAYQLPRYGVGFQATGKMPAVPFDAALEPPCPGF
jgi:hypothetical protein